MRVGGSPHDTHDKLFVFEMICNISPVIARKTGQIREANAEYTMRIRRIDPIISVMVGQ